MDGNPPRWVSGFGFLVSGFGSRVSGFGSRVSGLGFRFSGFCRVSGFRSRVSDLGVGVERPWTAGLRSLQGYLAYKKTQGYLAFTGVSCLEENNLGRQASWPVRGLFLFLLFFMTLEPRVENLRAFNTSPSRNRSTFLLSGCS